MAFTYTRVGSYSLSGLRAQILGTGLPGPLSITSGGVLVFAVALSTAEEASLYSVMDAYQSDPLSDARSDKIADIDSRTRDLIDDGFYYSGLLFSLSPGAQMKLLGTHGIRDDPALVYPIRWNSGDDEGYVDLADSDALHGFYLSAMGTMRSHLDAGTALKDQVRAALTVSDVTQIVDNR